MDQLGQVLLAGGLVSAGQLTQGLEEQRRTGRSLGRVLVDTGVLGEGQLVTALARQLGLPVVELTETQVDGAAVGLVPEALCRRHVVVPVALEGDRLVLAMADPADVFALDDVRSVTGREVRCVVAAAVDVLAALDRHHRRGGGLEDIAGGVGELESAEPVAVRELAQDAPIVKFVNLLITQAVQDRASDVHLEPAERELRVRFRIDGVLHEVMRSPKTIASGVVSRLKILADLDIAERRIPQDGRISLPAAGRKIDLRMATLPTVWGEKVVLRVLDNSTAARSLADLGFTDANYARFSRSFAKPHGMILVTGPTGSGKSTTLYSTLGEVSTPEKNVITVEDPVEYRLPGINQVQTNAKAGLTFARTLRAILRSDPDVVLLGEIRDHETAQIAVEAALTGHLVLSTLHTNDAPSAVNRLVEMGIEPFLVGSALDCVLAQRLARRLCDKCKEPYAPAPEALLAAGFPWRPGEELPLLYRPVGCALCSRTGYRGRLALHEVMAVSEEVERLAVDRASATAIRATAREQGMSTLREDGLAKALTGVTSVEEVLRVVV